jgi:hypothetical protein
MTRYGVSKLHFELIVNLSFIFYYSLGNAGDPLLLRTPLGLTDNVFD